MTKAQLFEQIRKKRSFLCVGLDTDVRKIPKTGTSNPIFAFNKNIIDATAQYTVAYKLNLAFYEAFPVYGIQALGHTCSYIRKNYPDILIIADAKRGDIGNTSEMYADAFFPKNEESIFDAVTLAPYMGRDTVEPFLKYKDKWAVVLALTSNPSADDFETLKLASGEALWQRVLSTAKTWGTAENMMFVVGATRAETLSEVRKIVPDHFLLVPGVGAQGGSLEEVAKYGMNRECGLLVNSSRGIIYAADPAAEARKMAEEMSTLLEKYL